MPSEITAEFSATGGMTIGRVRNFRAQGRLVFDQSVTLRGVLLLYTTRSCCQRRARRRGGLPARLPRRARDGARDIETTFDWERGIIRTVIQGSSEVPLPETQDRLSVMYQFMNLDRAAACGGARDQWAPGGEQHHRFVDEARIPPPAGEFDTMHCQRVTSGPKENRAGVLAKDRFNFPVRVVFDDPKGLRVQQTLVALESR